MLFFNNLCIFIIKIINFRNSNKQNTIFTKLLLNGYDINYTSITYFQFFIGLKNNQLNDWNIIFNAFKQLQFGKKSY